MRRRGTAPDDAPELTEALLDDAEYFHGDTFIRRGGDAPSARRGRPKLDAPKQQINIRLDADVLARLRQNGPGWQTRINEILRGALGLGKDATTPTSARSRARRSGG